MHLLAVVIVWKDADIKEALTPSFSPVFPQQIFCSRVSELKRFQEKEEDAFSSILWSCDSKF